MHEIARELNLCQQLIKKTWAEKRRINFFYLHFCSVVWSKGDLFMIWKFGNFSFRFPFSPFFLAKVMAWKIGWKLIEMRKFFVHANSNTFCFCTMRSVYLIRRIFGFSWVFMFEHLTLGSGDRTSLNLFMQREMHLCTASPSDVIKYNRIKI